MAQFGQGQAVRIACVNHSHVGLGGPTFDELTAALQKFYDECFLPVWGYPVELYNVRAGRLPKSDEWQMVYLDNADAANALGYHDLTKNRQPVSKIFTHTTLQAGEKISVTACHELCEMVIDPNAQLWALDTNTNILHAYEMCDAVEEDTFEVDGIEMSNFLHPSAFESFQHPYGTKYDHLGLLTAPFTMTKGGYQIHMRGGRVTEVYGSLEKKRRFAGESRIGHRSEHRKWHNGQSDAKLIR